MKDKPALADHTTPFVRNEWYVAANSEEVGRTLLGRQILGIGVLLYRKEDGTAVAMRNRCPHRSFPLSHGQLVGDTVECGYHGVRFGADGRCVEVPAQDIVPSSLKTPSYPLVERAPWLWIWMGDPALADPSDIPDHHWLSAPDYASFSGYMHCRTNYVRLHENVLDLTHFPYLHGEALGDREYIMAPFKVRVEDESVVITRRLENQPVNAAYAQAIGNAGHRCNRTAESWFKTPGLHIAHATIDDIDGGVGGRTAFHFKIVHCFTPETPHSTHYFYGTARDSAIDDEAMTAAMEKATRATFTEDEVALEQVERSWIEEDVADYQELNLRGDLAGLHMRRIIANRAAREREKASEQLVA